MWRFKRSDAFQRNEWNNYTNWAYKDIQPQKNFLLTGDIISQTAIFECKYALYYRSIRNLFQKCKRHIN